MVVVLARLTKAQTRSRLQEAHDKCVKVLLQGQDHLTPAQKKQVNDAMAALYRAYSGFKR